MHAPALSGDPAPLPFRRATPHPVFDAVVQGVFEAGRLNRTISTNAASDLDSHAVAGEERLGGQLPALALSHPGGVQFSSTSVESFATKSHLHTSKTSKEPRA